MDKDYQHCHREIYFENTKFDQDIKIYICLQQNQVEKSNSKVTFQARSIGYRRKCFKLLLSLNNTCLLIDCTGYTTSHYTRD